jgi:hypothetical protein
MHQRSTREQETGVETARSQTQIAAMPMSVDQLMHEARQLPRAQAADLLDRLLADTLATPNPETDQVWKKEIRRRITEIESGREPGVDGDTVMAELRKIVGR